MPARPAILWFRRDLRVTDNAALLAAVNSGQPVVPVYVLDTVSPGRWRPGAASMWWLGRSLESLRDQLAQLGTKLIVLTGDAREVLARLVVELDAEAIYCSRDYEPWSMAVEQDVHRMLEARGSALKRFRGRLLFEPDVVATQDGHPYKVFTPFWRAVSKHAVGEPLEAPGQIKAARGVARLDDGEVWQRLGRQPAWSDGFRGAWTPGEAGAAARLATFLAGGLSHYRTGRDRPDLASTSGLSPHLHFGEISIRSVWHAVNAKAAWDAAVGSDCETFLKELVWREFSYNLLFHWPTLPDLPLRSEFERFEWANDPGALEAWQKGQTGYPIVDAGMRQLWQTGWMHNRIRMIVASFLIKDLLVPWQHGEAWFWDTLVDADLASNAASWQWVAGCGSDAAPYFRIFNPVKQGKTFDPNGDYIRSYVPELSRLPTAYIHAPWEAPREVLEQAGVTIGETYPDRMVDHVKARDRALELYQRVKSAGRLLPGQTT